MGGSASIPKSVDEAQKAGYTLEQIDAAILGAMNGKRIKQLLAIDRGGRDDATSVASTVPSSLPEKAVSRIEYMDKFVDPIMAPLVNKLLKERPYDVLSFCTRYFVEKSASSALATPESEAPIEPLPFVSPEASALPASKRRKGPLKGSASSRRAEECISPAAVGSSSSENEYGDGNSTSTPLPSEALARPRGPRFEGGSEEEVLSDGLHVLVTEVDSLTKRVTYSVHNKKLLPLVFTIDAGESRGVTAATPEESAAPSSSSALDSTATSTSPSVSCHTHRPLLFTVVVPPKSVAQHICSLGPSNSVLAQRADSDARVGDVGGSGGASLPDSDEWVLNVTFWWEYGFADGGGGAAVARSEAEEVSSALAAVIEAGIKPSQLGSAQAVRDAMNAAGLPKGSFVDPEFPPGPSAAYANPDPPGTEMSKQAPLWWRRPGAVTLEEAGGGVGSHEVLFKEIEPTDVKQGSLGDCWFLAALATLAEFPSLVQELFGDQTAETAEGVYEVKCFKQGLPVTVIIDDLLPCDMATGQPAYGDTDGPELWVCLLEKAWAKLHGAYSGLENGDPLKAICDLTGCVGESFIFSSDLEEELESGQVFKKLVQFDSQGFLMCASTPGVDDLTKARKTSASNQKAKKKRGGIVPGHAYSVLSAKAARGQRLVQLRNPWGAFEWDGPFSDSSECWTPELVEAFRPNLSEKDGTFWMEADDFFDTFNVLQVVYTRGHASRSSSSSSSSPTLLPWATARVPLGETAAGEFHHHSLAHFTLEHDLTVASNSNQGASGGYLCVRQADSSSGQDYMYLSCAVFGPLGEGEAADLLLPAQGGGGVPGAFDPSSSSSSSIAAEGKSSCKEVLRCELACARRELVVPIVPREVDEEEEGADGGATGADAPNNRRRVLLLRAGTYVCMVYNLDGVGGRALTLTLHLDASSSSVALVDGDKVNGDGGDRGRQRESQGEGRAAANAEMMVPWAVCEATPPSLMRRLALCSALWGPESDVDDGWGRGVQTAEGFLANGGYVVAARCTRKKGARCLFEFSECTGWKGFLVVASQGSHEMVAGNGDTGGGDGGGPLVEVVLGKEWVLVAELVPSEELGEVAMDVQVFKK